MAHDRDHHTPLRREANAAEKCQVVKPMPRSAIPEAIKRQVLVEAGYRCGVPTCRALLILDLHHIIDVAEGGGNESGNLLPLCPTCHALYTRGSIPRDAIHAWKVVLVSLSAAFDRRTIDDLIFLDEIQQTQKDFVCTGDGVSRFTQLYAAGLAKYQRFHGLRGGMNVDSYRVEITSKGQRLLEGWRAGNSSAVDTALGMDD